MSDNDREKQGTQLAPNTIREFLENQKRELEIRVGELQLKTQEDQNAFVHAGRALEAQERDRKDQRQSKLRGAKYRYWFIGAIVFAAFIFILLLAWMGKDQMATELIKACVYIASGAIGGFFYGKGKPNRGGSQENDDSSDND